MSIKKRLVCVLLAAVTLPVAVITSLNYLNARETIEGQVLSGHHLIAEGAAGAVLEFLESKRQRTIDFASEAFIRREVERITALGDPGARARESRHLQDYLQKQKQPLDPDIIMIHLLDASGRFIASDDPAHLGRDTDKDQPYFIRGMKSAYVQSPYLHIHHGMGYHFIPVAAPIVRERDGRVIGVLMNGYDIKNIRDILTGARGTKLGLQVSERSGPFHTGIDIHLVNNDRTFLVPPADLADADYQKIRVNSSPVTNCLESGRNIRGEWEGRSGEKVWGASECLQAENDWRWTLIVKQDRKIALAPVLKLRDMSIAAGLIFLIIAAAIAVSTADAIAGPIKRLIKGTETIGGGDLDFRLSTDSRDEIGQLGRAFDAMTAKLKETTASRDDLVREIREREKAEERLGDERAFTEKALNVLHDIFFVIDLQGRLVRWNRMAETVSGYTAGELRDRSVSTLFPAEEAGRLSEAIASAVDEGYAEFQASLVTKDGRQIPCEYTGSLLKDAAGNPFAITGVGRDITERIRASEKLDRIRKDMRTIIDSMPFGVVVVGMDKRIRHMNYSALSMIGYEKSDEVTGRSCSNIFCPAGAEECPIIDLREDLDRSERILVQKDGRRVPIIKSAVPITFEGQAAILEAFVDISEIKQAEEELAFLASIVRNIPDAVCSIDIEGNITSWNRGAERMLGFSAEEITGKPILSVIPEELGLNEINHCITVLNSDGIITGYESVRIAKNRELIPVELTAVVLRDPNGFISGYASIMRDISERKHAEEERRRMHEFNRNILESVDEGFIVVDPEFRIISANRAYADMVDMEPDAILGRPCYEVSHHTHLPCHSLGDDCGVQRTFETGIPCRVVHTHYDSKDNPLYVELKAFPMKDSSGKVVSVIEVANDITYRVKLEEQLRHAQKMEAVGQLAAGIAHDFNNILGAMVNYVQLLQMKSPDEGPAREFIDQILQLIERATGLTQGLLAFSRKQDANLATVDLNDILTRIRKLLARVIGEDIEIVLDLEGETCTAIADSLQIEQVLMNLATNTRDAMPQGGTVTISTRVRDVHTALVHDHGLIEVGRYAVISFSDTGTGMDNQTMQKIFDPFFTTKEVGKGTGLGLAMVYGIIRQHQGHITVESEPGRGTTFRIYLPSVQDRQPEQPKAADPELLSGRGETILLGEDDAILRDVTRKILESVNYRVLVAKDGEETIRIFREHEKEIALVLLDVIMPKKNGREVAAEVRKARPDIPVLFMSGYPEKVGIRKQILSEDDECLLKPVSPVHLMKRIRELLGR